MNNVDNCNTVMSISISKHRKDTVKMQFTRFKKVYACVEHLPLIEFARGGSCSGRVIEG